MKAQLLILLGMCLVTITGEHRRSNPSRGDARRHMPHLPSGTHGWPVRRAATLRRYGFLGSHCKGGVFA
jgi:hypothetical protein